MKRRKGLKALLVTWEHCAPHARPSKRAAEILNPRMSAERVREIVELLYHGDTFLSEKVSWRLRKQKQPYPAEFVTIDGVPWEGQIICGHHPWLLARQVDNLILGVDGDGAEIASWTDR